jgi:CDP-glucose 4,6-dehydratase
MSAPTEFWSGRRVLITGHTGFKGAWLALLLRSLGAEVSGLALPPDPRGAFERLVPALALGERSHFGDIRDRSFVDSVMAERQPEVVFHLAAQALVRRSFVDPAETFAVNVTGPAVVLAAAAAAGSVRVVVAVTSDKVYANDGSGRVFVESDRLGGGDPYSASKAAAELVVDSWRHSFGGDPVVVSARAGNVIGGGDQAPDRLIPDLFRALEAGRPLVLRHPASVRPWQFVLEPLAGYVIYAAAAWADRATVPAALNFGPGPASSWSVADVVEALLRRAGRGDWEQANETTGGPEATTLTLDSSLAGRALGWKPVLDLDTALDWTMAWWQAEQAGTDLAEVASEQIARYREMMSA